MVKRTTGQLQRRPSGARLGAAAGLGPDGRVGSDGGVPCYRRHAVDAAQNVGPAGVRSAALEPFREAVFNGGD